MIMILLIMQLILDIVFLISLCKLYKIIKPKIDIPEDHNSDIDIYAYLHSLDFNMLLDSKIQPLLGKYRNEDIVNHVIQSFEKDDPIISQFDNDILKSYIGEVLLNYNNNYNEEEKYTNYINETLDDIKYNTHDKELSTTEVNLSSTLNNFYRD